MNVLQSRGNYFEESSASQVTLENKLSNDKTAVNQGKL